MLVIPNSAYGKATRDFTLTAEQGRKVPVALSTMEQIITRQSFFTEVKVCSEIPVSKNLHHVETSQLISFVNQLTGFSI